MFNNRIIIQVLILLLTEYAICSRPSAVNDAQELKKLADKYNVQVYQLLQILSNVNAIVTSAREELNHLNELNNQQKIEKDFAKFKMYYYMQTSPEYKYWANFAKLLKIRKGK